MEPQEELKSFIETGIKGLCKQTAAVSVNVIPSGGKTVCFIIHCDPTDMSFVIGREGRNIKAIREVTWAIAAKYQFKATVIVNE